MDGESIRVLDDVNDLDVIEVHWLTAAGDERVSVGPYGGLKRGYFRGWWLRIIQRPSIRCDDIQQIRILTAAKKS